MLGQSRTIPVAIGEDLTLSIFHGKDGLNAIQDDWMKLNDAFGLRHFYQSLPWYRSYLEVFDADEQSVSFYVFYRQQSPLAIYPLRRGRLRLNGISLRCLELPRHPHLYLRDCVCDPSEESADLFLSLVSYLRRQTETSWDLIYLSHVPEDSAISLAIRKKLYPLSISKPSGRSSYMPCGESYSTVEQNMSGTFRRNLRRLARRAEQAGPLELRICSTPEELRQAFPTFLNVEASGWKGGVGTGTAIVCQPDLIEFYRKMMEYFSATGECVIHLLVQNGTCIAGQFCVHRDGVLNILKIGYHEAYSEFAPGNLLMSRVLEHSCRSGRIKIVSFVTDPVWSRAWRPSSFSISDHYIFNRTWRGVLAGLMATGRNRVGQLVKGRAGGSKMPETDNSSIAIQEDNT
jgi:CelD/BcsL family acetyltransferase involved in cellulose biosynthesis